MVIIQPYIADVVPLTRIPLSRNQAFSYSASENIQPGTLVSVPLFYRNIEGVVIACYSRKQWTKKFALKSIRSILAKSFLTSRQLELAEFISEYYICPLGIVLKSFVPKRVKARKKIKENKLSLKIKKITLTLEQKFAVKKILSSKFKIQNSKFYLYGPSGSGKTEVYIEAIKNLPPEKQALVLLPDLTLTPQAIEQYGAHFPPDKIAVLHSKISKGEFYKNWEKIRSGEAKIIIGSRVALFAPFKDLGLIVVDEEHDISFKQWDMSPRYDTRKAAERLSDIHECRLVLGSSTPCVSSFYKAAKKEYQLLTLPPLKLRRNFPEAKLELVDMRKERWKKNYSPVSKRLETEIAYALKYKLQVILFVNRQGMSQFSICAHCRAVLRCPKCERALVYDQEGFYYCLHCSYHSTIVPHCSACNGIIFRNVGLGTQKIEKEIKSRFPSAQVARADRQTMRDIHTHEKLYQEFKDKKIDILIGTQMISKGWDLPSVALVGIIDADNLLSLPDFRAHEKAYQNILQTAGRAGRPGAKFPGLVIIQTFHPESSFLQTIVKHNFLDFYQQEIKEREALNLPPFFRIVKLVFGASEKIKVDQECRRVYGLIQSLAHEHAEKKIIKIFEPQSPFVSKIRGKFKKQIIIKIRNNKEIPPELKRIIVSLPVGWIVDIDAISII